MFVLEVLPISKGLRKDSLTYISREPVAVGATVIVPIRSKDTPAIVINRTPASEAKLDLKRADFSLRSVTRTSALRLADPSIITAALATARKHFVAPVHVLGRVLPSFHIEKILEDEYSPCFIRSKDGAAHTRPDETLLQLPWTERIQYIRTYIRRLFSSGQSLVIVVPTLTQLERWADALGVSTGTHLYTLSSQDSSAEIMQKLALIHTEEHPVVIITTPLLLYAVPPNTNTVIFENSGSANYRDLPGLRFDLATYIQEFTQAAGIKLIYSASVTDLRLMRRFRSGTLPAETETSFRIERPRDTRAICLQPLAAQAERTGARTPFFAPETVAQFESTLTQGKAVFFFVPRTGEAPLTICRDCQTVLRCPTCEHVVTRHVDPSKNRYEYSCHHCHRPYQADHTCSNCGGHTFWYQGIGTETIADYLGRHYRDVPITILDGEHQKTHRQLTTTLAEIDPNTPRYVIGTSRALPMLPQFDTTIIVSLDALAVHPDPDIYTEIATIITTLTEKTAGHLVAQYRTLPDTLEHLASQGSLLPWYEQELTVREKLRLPPFRPQLEFTWQPGAGRSEEHRDYLAKIFGKQTVFLTPGMGTNPHAILVSIEETHWQEWIRGRDSKLGRILTTLYRYYTIRAPAGTLAPLR